MRPTTSSLPMISILTLAVAAPSVAQVRLEVTSFAGAYLPHTYVAHVSPGGLCDFDSFSTLGCFEGEVSQKAAPIVGEEITAWMGKRFAADLSFGYSASAMVSRPVGVVTTDPSVGGDTSAHILTGTARLLVNLTPRQTRSTVYLVGGLAFLTHRGDGYVATARSLGSAVPGSTDWGPVVGVGARIGLTHALATRAELQDYLYAHGPGADVAHFRGDFVFSLGVSATLLSPRAPVQ